MEYYIIKQEEQKMGKKALKFLHKFKTRGSILITAFLILLAGGVLSYLLGYPSAVLGNAADDAAQRYQDWVNAGSPDYNNSGGGGSSEPACQDKYTDEEECRENNPSTPNDNEYCTWQHVEKCGQAPYDTDKNCRRERGKCGYWGICIPRPCDNNKTCYGACRAFNDNTCNTNNGEQDNCYYLGRGDGKGCVPTATSNQPCTIDTCWYNRGYACSQELNKCAYVTPWLDVNGNTHLNH